MIRERGDFKREKHLGEDKNRRRNIVTLCAMLMILLIGSASAYFLSSDSADNEWTVGEVNIELLEPEYDASNRENVTPNQSLPKDPQVKNTGSNDVFVFMKVNMPKDEFSLADGNNSPVQLQELFEYRISEDWLLVDSDETNETYNEYVYAYAEDGVCKSLVPENTTSPLFDEGVIKLKNFHANALSSSELQVKVEAYGIQSNNITDENSDDPSVVWAELLDKELGA